MATERRENLYTEDNGCFYCSFWMPWEPYCHPHIGEFKKSGGKQCKYFRLSASYQKPKAKQLDLWQE